MQELQLSSKDRQLKKSANKSDNKTIALLRHMMVSREAENRENILFRQGRGQFHLPSAGHEGMAALASLIKKDDWFYCYYRDRALLLAMGVPLEEIARSFFAKEQTSSGGRQMASHFSYKPLNVVSCATPTGLQCLPAAGTAWAFKKEKTDNVVFCSIGDASTRQGEFFEALAFSIQEQLPIVFMVEDNGYGISTPTEDMSPLTLGMIPENILHTLDGTKADALAADARSLIDQVRNGDGPKVLWINMPRLMSHTSSDDQTKYRSEKELSVAVQNDPLGKYKTYITTHNIMEEAHITFMEREIFEYVKTVYSRAEKEPNPKAKDVTKHIFSERKTSKPFRSKDPEINQLMSWNMSKAFNSGLEQLLQDNSKTIIFGEDIEDPKGGVFGLTRGLSSKYPDQVFNSPLAEATIAGLASGLSMKGVLPIFELQFIDFIGPAFNQIVNQIATLRWRSVGEYKCPLIIYAPCGSYISGGGPWHSQTNESWLAHAPGLKTYMPSNANDAVNMLYDAAHGEDPVIMLLPKNQFQKNVHIEKAMPLYPEKAHIRKSGSDITIVAWGNCSELAAQASRELENSTGISCEIIDLPSIVPCDYQTIKQSIMKTGRLIVVQEDNKTCSFGQAIITEMVSDKAVWESMYTPPQLLSRGDVHIGFNAILENAVLPNAATIIETSRTLMGANNV